MASLTRQNVLIVLSLVTIAGGAMFGAGAFTQVQADRTVTAATAGDGSAYLEFEPTSEYTSLDTNDEFQVTLDSLNGNATTQVDYAFNISVSDQTSGTYDIYVDDSDDGVGSTAELEFEDMSDDSSITSSENAASVQAGTSIEVRITVDLTDGNDVSEIPSEITFVASEQ